ncbi:MAG: hypothetical protein WCX77_02260 [Candidatus Paceibacterota bacterium]|jgi:hypothetical protein
MKFIVSLKKIICPNSKKTEKNFSDFLVNAPAKDKIKIFTNAARCANEEQRKTAEKANLKLKTE